MEDKPDSAWLVDIFLSYRTTLDNQRKLAGDRLWLKDALDSDRKNKSAPRNSASSLNPT